ncbi:uncharacterized protein LOC134832321 [Culicoides brevitarsis]|uniref:uncharacterized protein LOC134832321 n=1 Tax=Culicoides brevitarsis TaxID=469753 RepID=UPI00307C7CFF
MIELKEICSLSYQHKSVQPFSIQTSPNGTFSITTKTAVQIMKPQFKHNPDLNLFNLKPAVVQCPLDMPTNELDTEEVEIYNNADKLERKSLLLDQRFLPKLSNKDVSELVQSRAVAWNGSGKFAYLSTYGGIEIFEEINEDNEWKSVVNVGKEYLKYVKKDKKSPLKTMNELESHVEDLLLTSIVFCNVGDEEFLLATTKSSKMVTFRVNFQAKTVEIVRVSEIFERNINRMTVISTKNEVFVAVGSNEGQISLYKVQKSGEICSRNCLWEDKDLLAVSDVQISTLDDGFLAVASKGGHLLAFKLDSKMSCVKKSHEMLTSMPITGLMKTSETSFITVSLNNEVKSVQICPKTLKISSTNVQLDFSLSGNTVYGIAPSHNQAYFVLLSFVTQAHDHLTLRQPLNLTLCRLGSSNPIEKLLSMPSMSLKTATDYLELIRYLGAKDQKMLQLFEKSIDLTKNIGFTKNFEFQVKISAVLAGARFTYFRLRSAAESEVSTKRMERLGQILEVIRASHALNFLAKNGAKSEFECLSARCLRLSILEYVAATPATDELLKIYEALTPELIILAQKTENLGISEAESCTICGKMLEMNSLTCEEGHVTIRCCLTKVQIDDFNPKTCSQCQRSIWNDLEMIKKVIGSDENLLLCPLCDISFTNKVEN